MNSLKTSLKPGVISVLLVVGLIAIALLLSILWLGPAKGKFGLLSQKKEQQQPSYAQDTTGTGAPRGTHYNLNVIGVPKGKTADITSGNRIFVPLVGNCKINLAEGIFSVLDANCTDDNKAQFQLPNPDPTNTGTTTYSVWVRALGKPGGQSATTTCATEVATGETYCSVYTMVQIRNKGKSSFTDVSKYLLYIYADINDDGVLERYPLFDDALQDYYWNYDNNGLKLLQLRFYPVASTVPAP